MKRHFSLLLFALVSLVSSADTGEGRFNVQSMDPVGYWTQLYVVSDANMDNVATFRNQTANVNGQNALRMQDYLGNERGAMGYGNIRNEDAFNRAMFVEIGNIADNSSVTAANAKGTSFKIVNTHLNRPDFASGVYTALLVGEYGELVYKGGQSALPGANAISLYIDRQGFVGVGPSFQVPNPYLADAKANLQSRFQVNGNVFIDPDNLGASGDANSASLVVERAAAAAFVAIRAVHQNVGSVAIGYSTKGVIGVDIGDVEIKTGLTGADLTTGTSRLKVKATGQVRFIPLSAAPANAEEGDVYYDSALKKHRGYDGTNWNAFY